jgi:hypothetical protein
MSFDGIGLKTDLQTMFEDNEDPEKDAEQAATEMKDAIVNNFTGVSGATGTFKDFDGNTITVSNGVITDLGV